MNLSDDPQTLKGLREEGLRYCNDREPGFFRERVGFSFNHYDTAGKRITEKGDLKRIKDLVIPPAWKNVWICPYKNGHLQATGVDEKGRKQYLYHTDWIKISQQNKFSKMVDFGLSLPKIRSKIKYHMQSKKLDKTKILATIIWLLEHTFIRIGNDEYAENNNSYGLTTLRNKHVEIRGSEVIFRFRGKSGVSHVIEIDSPAVAKTVKKCVELPGYELFKFIGEDGSHHIVDSSDVNLFLKEASGDDFSAKDFRTWGATDICANNFYNLGFPDDKKQVEKNIVTTVKQVAHHLHNTVSVCKNYYIHPTVLTTYQQNLLIPHYTTLHKSKDRKRGLSWDEYALVKLLQKYS